MGHGYRPFRARMIGLAWKPKCPDRLYGHARRHVAAGLAAYVDGLIAWQGVIVASPQDRIAVNHAIAAGTAAIPVETRDACPRQPFVLRRVPNNDRWLLEVMLVHPLFLSQMPHEPLR
ncbi:hypothetical protein JOC55_005265 [Paenibacillus sacheonensis]|nr:hypothetical protein [Paenibacillus sacheonensis]